MKNKGKLLKIFALSLIMLMMCSMPSLPFSTKVEAALATHVTGDDIINQAMSYGSWTYTGVGTCTGLATRVLRDLGIGSSIVDYNNGWFNDKVVQSVTTMNKNASQSDEVMFVWQGYLSDVKANAGKFRNGDILFITNANNPTRGSEHVGFVHIVGDSIYQYGAKSSSSNPQIGDTLICSGIDWNSVTLQSSDNTDAQGVEPYGYVPGGDWYTVFYRLVDDNPVGNLKIEKKDNHGQYKANATFHVSGPAGEFDVTTNDAGYAELNDLKVGNYVITETQAPENMTNEESGRSVTVTVNRGESVTYTRINSYQRGSSAIHKIDAYEGETPKGDAKLSGAEYKLYANEDIYEGVTKIYSNGEVVATKLTKENGYTDVVDNLPIGKYYWKETNASEGYNVNDEKIEFSIDYEGQYVLKAAYEEFISQEDKIYGRARVIKMDNTTDGSTLKSSAEGAILKLTLDDDPTQYYLATVDEKGVAEFIDEEFAKLHPEEKCTIPYGRYTLTEVQASNKGVHTYFYINPEPIVLYVDQETEIRYVIDEPVEAYLKIVKIDAISKLPVKLTGAKFKIWDCQKNEFVAQNIYPSFELIDEFETNDEGYLVTPKTLAPGQYIVYETKAPTGYTLNEKYKLPDNEADYGVKSKGGMFVDLNKEMLGVSEDADYDKDNVLIYKVEIPNYPLMGKIKVVKTGEMLTDIDTEVSEYGEIIKPSYSYKGLENVEYTIKPKEAIKSPDGSYEYVSTDKEYVIRTDENGEAITEDLYLGIYEIVESETPLGYVTDTNIPDITLTNDGETEEIETTVKELQNVKQKTEITIKKQFEKSNFIINEDDNIKVVIGIFANQDFKNYNQTETLIQKGNLVDVVIGECESDGTEVTIKSEVNLPAGEYYAQELDVSSPYVADTTKHTFTIAHTNTTDVKVTITGPTIINTQPKVGSLVLIKFSASSFADAENTGIKGTKINKDVVDEKIAEFMDELKGKTKAEAIDYIKNNNKISLTGAKYGIYTDEECTKPLKMRTENGNSEIVEIITDGNGMYEIPAIPIGKYYLKELEAPDGYKLSEDVVTIDINRNDVDQVVYRALYDEMVDGPEFIVKTDIFTGEAIEDCIFEIKDKDGNVIIHSITDENGEASVLIDLLKRGETYTYTEIEAPGIYDLNTEPHTFVANYEYDEETGKYRWLNPPEEVDNRRKTIKELIVRKVDEKTGEPLQGCKFSIVLLDVNGNPYVNSEGKTIYLVENAITDENGEYKVENPYYGKFKFIEVEAPEGYEKIEEDMEGMTFEISDKSPDTIIFEVTNTGDIAVFALAAVAVLSVVGIIFVITKNRRKSTK